MKKRKGLASVLLDDLRPKFVSLGASLVRLLWIALYAAALWTIYVVLDRLTGGLLFAREFYNAVMNAEAESIGYRETFALLEALFEKYPVASTAVTAGAVAVGLVHGAAQDAAEAAARRVLGEQPSETGSRGGGDAFTPPPPPPPVPPAPPPPPPPERSDDDANAAVRVYEQLLRLWMHLENFRRVTPSRDTLLAALKDAQISFKRFSGADSYDDRAAMALLPQARAVLDLAEKINAIIEDQIAHATRLQPGADPEAIGSIITTMSMLLDDLFFRLEDAIFGFVMKTQATSGPRDRLNALKDSFFFKRPR